MRYHGGKFRLAEWITSHFPPHRVYTEPFGGAASVLMHKPRASVAEIYNDLDDEIVNVFGVLREPAMAVQLRDALQRTPYARIEFELSYDPSPDAVEQARRTLVRSFMGFGSDSASRAKTGFRANSNRSNSHPANDWSNLPTEVLNFTERLKGVVLENRAAIDILRHHDSPTTLHYLDPPYPECCRSRHTTRVGKGYRHEMTDQAHRDLLREICSLEGMVIVSGYSTPLYEDALPVTWKRVSHPSYADGARRRIEMLWINPQAAHNAPLALPFAS